MWICRVGTVGVRMSQSRPPRRVIIALRPTVGNAALAPRAAHGGFGRTSGRSDSTAYGREPASGDLNRRLLGGLRRFRFRGATAHGRADSQQLWKVAAVFR
jgi:hypothetical protein